MSNAVWWDDCKCLTVATALGLKTFTTPAMDDTAMLDLLDLDGFVMTPSYTLCLGANC